MTNELRNETHNCSIPLNAPSLKVKNLLSSIPTMVVLEMLRWKAPAVLVLLLVLMTMNERVPQFGTNDWCEFFAGEGQVSLALWSIGLRGSSHDLRYDQLMNLCSDAGFATLDEKYVLVFFKLAYVEIVSECFPQTVFISAVHI